MEDLKYWVGFNIVPGVGPVRFRRLLDYFGEAQRAWQASASELARAGLDAKTAESVVATRGRVNLERELERLAQQGVQTLTWADEGYPRLLKEIHAPPPLLYVKGHLSPVDDLAVAVVGTRRATVYGKEVTRGAFSPANSTRVSPPRADVVITWSSPAPSAGHDKSERGVLPTNRW